MEMDLLRTLSQSMESSSPRVMPWGDFKSLLTGNFDLQTLPDIPSKTIRVYMCCTSTDTIQERNALIKNVYPKLREYCRENYGFEFQVVDPRWGLKEPWADNSPDRKLCLREIEECQRTSVGPNFVALVGQRYGDRPIPAAISAADFDLLRNTLRHHRNRETRDVWLLDQWYSKDDNAVPAQYLLQSEETVKANLKPQSAVDKMIMGDRSEVRWSDTKASLQRLLKKAVEYCLLEGTMVDSDAHGYLSSDLEKEIQQGVLFTSDPHSTCEVFVRDIVDLKNYVKHEKASKFMEIVFDEIDEKVIVDPDCEKMLNTLRNDKLNRWLGKSNIREFIVLWKHDNGIDLELHKDYLKQFCNTVHNDLRSLVDRVARAQNREPLPAMMDEVFQHWSIAKSKCENFVGREDILEIIRAYVQSNDQKPLVLYGEPGCGKTSIIAKAVSEARTWIEGDLITVVRFLGISTASFDIRQILYNICVQLAMVMGKDKERVPNSYKELQSYFFDILDNFPEEKNLVLFLDSLNMLVPQYNAHYLYWLPRQLKENVKIVVSTLPDAYNILTRLKTEVILDENNFVEIPFMSPDECMELLDALLLHENRRVSTAQRSVVREAFQKCGLPLFVKLLKSEARGWSSCKQIHCALIPSSVKAYINHMLEDMERRFGKSLVSRSIAILTASSTGVSEGELEDILSLDDNVLCEVFEDWQPPVRRLPSIAWLRLKHELRDFLTTRECEGVTVQFWNHRQFIEVAKSRYLYDDAKRNDIHSYLADYYLGVWHQKAKPYKRPPSANNNDVMCSEDRLVPSQPLTFQAENVTRYNKRKYDQVPRHLVLSGRLKELNELVLFSYEWLYNKAKALSLEHILADFVLNPGVEATLVERALRDATPYIAKNIDNMAPEITGRLLAYYGTHTNIRKLIQECDTAGLKHCALIPNFPYHQVPGSPLKYTIECKGKPTHFGLIGEDSRFIMTKQPASANIQVFDLATGETKSDICTSVGEMYVTPSGEYIAVVDHVTEKTIKIHEAATGRFLGQIIPMNQVQMKPKDKYKLGKISISDTHICVIVTTEKSYLCVADLATCKFVDVRGLEGRSQMCQITPDSRYVFCNSNEELLGYDLYTMEQVNNTTLEQRPKFITFNRDTMRGYMINDIENKVYVITFNEGKVEFMYKVVLTDSFPDDRLQHLQLSNSNELLLVRGQSNIVVYHVLSEKVVCQFHRPLEIPKEFKLPKSHYIDISFTQANFSPDDKFVIATIFRNVYIWHVTNNRLLTTLQAPVGLIKDLYIPSARGQIVTHLQNSNIIHVWSLGDAIGHVGMLDRLTTEVDEIQLTTDDRVAYVKCRGSDEIGVLDMLTGKLEDLLTHDKPVKSYAVSFTGTYACVALESAKANTVNKLWYTEGRKVIYEFGNVPCFSVPLQHEDSIFAIHQESVHFKAPYHISQFKFHNDTFDEYKFEYEIKFVLSAPFVTPDDRYLVILSADDYDETNAHYVNPTICALAIKSGAGASMSSYSAHSLRDRVRIRRFLHIRPYANNSYTVIALFTNEPDPVYNGTPDGRTSRAYDHCYGFMIFDVCSGVVCQVIDNFMAPQTPMDKVLFTKDVSLCIDYQSNIFDMKNGYFVKALYDENTPPARLALDGKVVVYFSGNYMFVLRVSDGRSIAHVNVHGEITCLEVCHDQRTIVAGCRDGGLVSYVLIDEEYDNRDIILQKIISRAVSIKTPREGSKSRSWDRVEVDGGPRYSRPPSAVTFGPTDRELLSRVKPVTRSRPSSDTVLYLGTNSAKSRACVVM